MNENNELKGLGGWLGLVGIGLILAPLRMLYDLIPFFTMFNDGTWDAISTAGSSFYPKYLIIIITEFICNLLILIGSLYTLYLYFSKHYRFPKFFIGFLIINFLFMLIDTWAGSLLLPDQQVFDEDSTMALIRIFVYSLIWIPYMLVSKRVKATFVEKKP